MRDQKVGAVFLAGGEGKRLWPLSQPDKPKQFIKSFGERSLFQLSILRNKFLGEPIILVNQAHLELASQQLAEIKVNARLIVEPVKKNTAPSSLLAAHYARRIGIKKLVLIPCDHYIDNNTEKYKDKIKLGANSLSEHKMVVIGVKPDKFSPEYGYIEAGEQLGEILKVKQFKEKPKFRQQNIYTSNPNFYWNSGIYFISIEYLIKLAQKLYPILASHTEKAILEANSLLEKVVLVKKAIYQQIEAQSFDIAFSQQAQGMVMIKSSFKWADLGTWPNWIDAIKAGYQPHLIT